MPSATAEPTKEQVQEKPAPKRAPVGIACKYCRTVANHPVKRCYPNKMRLRFCLSCRREFQTWEAIV